jgi:hypothetical protein
MDNRNHRGEELDPLTTTLLSTLLPRTVLVIPRRLLRIPCLTLACSHRQDGCTNGKISIFTLCYFSNGRQQRRGRAKLGKTTRISCFKCKVWMWCPLLNTTWRPKWGFSHSYTTVELLLMYDYYYGIVCTIITVIMVLYARLCVWGLYALLWVYDYGICMHYYFYALVWSFYIKMCIGHAKIFIFSTPVIYEKTAVTKANSPVRHAYWPVYHSYRPIYRSKPIHRRFVSVFWICVVFSGIPTVPLGIPGGRRYAPPVR